MGAAGDMESRAAGGKLSQIPSSNPALRHKPREMLKRPVICAFGICRKTTGRQLPGRQVKLQAITADAFSRTRFIAAITFLFILFLFTFHRILKIPDSRFEIRDSKYQVFNLESRISLLIIAAEAVFQEVLIPDAFLCHKAFWRLGDCRIRSATAHRPQAVVT